MAVGIIIGQFITPNIEAQSNGVFDKIPCAGSLRWRMVKKEGIDHERFDDSKWWGVDNKR